MFIAIAIHHAAAKHADEFLAFMHRVIEATQGAPAAGLGLHALVVTDQRPLRLTQAQLEAHPAWRGFSGEAGKHPPMRGWLAVPLIGPDQRHYGLLQLSDKYDDADFTEDDERHLTQLAQLTTVTLDMLCALYPDQGIGVQR
jgi:GAF domain-containing protein